MRSMKNVNNMKILAELERTPLKINIEIQMFKYLQQFTFIEKDRYVFKAFQEENQAIDGWVKHMKTKLELLGLCNLMGNIYKVISDKSHKKNTGQKIRFFRNEQVIATYKINFTTTLKLKIIGASLPY